MKPDVLEQLRDTPWAFDFFAAVRRIEQTYRDLPRVGHSNLPWEDPVRFAQHASLAFPPSTLHGLTEGEFPKLEVNFFGLLGPNGPLPAHLTEYARDRDRNARDSTLTAFLDVFHHRMISLFYRAWAANQKAADSDRPEESRFAVFLGSFLGFGRPSLQGRDSVPDNAKIHFAGRLISKSRNASGLQAILEGFFDVAVELETFAGHWLPIPRESRCRLGGGASCAALGESSILGSTVWDMQTRFRIRMGPMNLSRFRDFLPGGRSYQRVLDWVRLYTEGQFFWDLQPVLLRDEVPASVLGGGTMLGWTSWLLSEPCAADSGDLVLEPETLTDSQA